MGLRMERIGSVANMSMAAAYTASSADILKQLAAACGCAVGADTDDAVPPTRVREEVRGR